MARIKVAVSPFFGGEEWTDEGTGITFKKDRLGGMATYTIPEHEDLSGIRKAVQINALILVEGEFKDLQNDVVKEEPKEEVKEEEVKEEPVVEIKEEKPEENEEDKPASKSRKRSTKSSSKK